MSKPLRLLALAAALNITAATVAAGQTVIVKGAAPGDRVEVVVNATPANTGTVAADGTATIAGTVPQNAAGRPEMDSRLHLDSCDKLRRVHIVDRNQLPPPAADGCARTEVSGIYWVRQRSTIVIDVSGPIPDVLLRQGAYDPNAPVRRLAPPGLVVFGGGGLSKASNAAAIACGNVADCGDDGYIGAYSAGATLWVTRWLGVGGSYLRPSRMVVEGRGSTYNFTSEFDVDIINLVVTAGIPVGPVRIYGQGGTTYHDGTATLEQTIGDASQTIETSTDGWSYTYGGGGWLHENKGEGAPVRRHRDRRLAPPLPLRRALQDFLVVSEGRSPLGETYCGVGGVTVATSTSNTSVEFGGIGPLRTDP
jgi:hypothetical protein